MKKIIATALALMMCLCFISMTVCAAPDGLNSLAIAGTGIPEVREWDPADNNGDMVEQSESVFTKAISFSAPSTIEFKVAGNDTWDDNWNFGFATQGEAIVLNQKTDLVRGGGSQNMMLTVDNAGDYLITVDVAPLACGGAATILVEKNDPIPQPTTAEPTEPTTGWDDEIEDTNEKYTLTVEAPSTWSTVYVYTWEPQSFGDFPGTEMPKKSENTYECEIDGDLINLIFYNNNYMQTDNIRITPGKNVLIKIAEDASFTITYPDDPIIPRPLPLPEYPVSNYRVVGDADWLGAWDPAFEGGRMIDLGNGVYRKNFADVLPGSYQIKITKDGKWDGAYGDNGQNFCFTVLKKTKITVDFILRDGEGIIEVYGVPVVWDEDEEENPQASDQSVLIPAILLLTSIVALPVVRYKRKNTK